MIHLGLGHQPYALRKFITRHREFFEMLPTDAFDMLSAIATMHDKADKLKVNDKNQAV